MSDALLGVLIGGAFGFLGALLGFLGNNWIEGRKMERERLANIRLRLAGDRIQTSEVLDFIETNRERKWPRFWEKGLPDLSRANLQKVDLREQDLRGVIFFRADLREAELYRANLSGSDFSKAILSNADLYEANLSGAVLFGADLRGAILNKVTLKGAILSGAILSSADLREANLGGAKLRDADLSQADLRGSDLRGADFSEVRNLNEAQLDETTKQDSKTQWPDDFDIHVMESL